MAMMPSTRVCPASASSIPSRWVSSAAIASSSEASNATERQSSAVVSAVSRPEGLSARPSWKYGASTFHTPRNAAAANSSVSCSLTSVSEGSSDAVLRGSITSTYLGFSTLVVSNLSLSTMFCA